ncbi:MAG: hypothetical protein IIZ45_06870, partial [Firmicutes bacterium]|nr:hypothetical protein [Bacillota bacterium]
FRSSIFRINTAILPIAVFFCVLALAAGMSMPAPLLFGRRERAALPRCFHAVFTRNKENPAARMGGGVFCLMNGGR